MTKNINPEKIVVEVQPESMKLVIYGHTRNGISYSGGSSSTTLVTVKLDYEQLKSDCQKAEKAIRQIGGDDVASIQQSRFDGGIVYLYTNLTERVYNENVTYQFTNMEIVGFEGNTTLNIVLNAKQDRLVVIKQVDPGKIWGL